MDLKVIKTYPDKERGIVKEGEILKGISNSRGKELIATGYVEKYKEEKSFEKYGSDIPQEDSYRNKRWE